MYRSDPADTLDFHGADAPVLLSEGAAGQKVPVRFLPAGQLKLPESAAAANGAEERTAASEPPAAFPGAKAEPSGREDRRREDRDSRGGDRGRERGGDRHHRDRDRERDRERDGDRHRHDRDRDRVSERNRGRDDRGRERDTEGRQHREADRHAERGASVTFIANSLLPLGRVQPSMTFSFTPIALVCCSVQDTKETKILNNF